MNDGQWTYSEKALSTVREYMQKYVPGYTRMNDGQWTYSEKALSTVREYMQK